MLALGRALMASPRLMLVDEASMGLSPVMTERAFALIADINRTSGVAVLIVEQNVLALDLADRAYVLEKGQVVAAAEGAGVRQMQAQLREAYLGSLRMRRLWLLLLLPLGLVRAAPERASGLRDARAAGRRAARCRGRHDPDPDTRLPHRPSAHRRAGADSARRARGETGRPVDAHRSAAAGRAPGHPARWRVGRHRRARRRAGARGARRAGCGHDRGAQRRGRRLPAVRGRRLELRHGRLRPAGHPAAARLPGRAPSCCSRSSAVRRNCHERTAPACGPDSGVLAAAAVVGGVGWYRVSGEPLLNRQIPFLASAGIVVVLLSVLGGSLIIAEQLRGDQNRIGDLEDAVRALTEALAPTIEAPPRIEEPATEVLVRRSRGDRGAPPLAVPDPHRSEQRRPRGTSAATRCGCRCRRP